MSEPIIQRRTVVDYEGTKAGAVADICLEMMRDMKKVTKFPKDNWRWSFSPKAAMCLLEWFDLMPGASYIGVRFTTDSKLYGFQIELRDSDPYDHAREVSITGIIAGTSVDLRGGLVGIEIRSAQQDLGYSLRRLSNMGGQYPPPTFKVTFEVLGE